MSVFNVSSVLMCHAPIVIPEIAGSDGFLVKKTTEAMSKVAQFINFNEPDTVILLSPHTPRSKHSFNIVLNETLYGDFAQFGNQDIRLNFENDVDFVQNLLKSAPANKINLKSLYLENIDHGALVPLYFLKKARVNAKLALIANPYDCNITLLNQFANFLKQSISKFNKKFLILASGDMSHRLNKEAPSGYHPEAIKFDQEFVKLVTNKQFQAATQISEISRFNAAEDVVDTFTIATAATGFQTDNFEFLSYEAPFGVGYFVAILNSGVSV